ncbi:MULTISPECIES: hypothetical protein [Rhodopseudomonas]|uniref:Uncharacterized protein n=1 Tax=Rhodopseudomonas palustris TaxID=1076 RepID=A0A0D7EQX9_RHOPL|nr:MULTISPECIES: hypothetical protein [Rhodopseudomonas]KIZ42955.1 hypothetical protein OO17_12075 [Rhodopseudomonas palustris]MDF3813979.1 hypothetical protein [Rhodopseudomonas sp. BAL398]WOK19940.1 hypothetical protein RBJ75_10665 [Rhodopseudomonas sp. BAL398]
MSQTSIERLREYLAQLPPQSKALLMREFERAIERGEDLAVANFVLGELRKIVRGSEDDVPPRTDDPARLAFRVLEPFLVEQDQTPRPGQIRRASLMPIWQWLVRDGIPQQVAEFEAGLAGLRGASRSTEIHNLVRKLQAAAADAITKIANPEPGVDRQRALSRVGSPAVVEDLVPLGAVLKNRDALDTFNGKLNNNLRVFGESQVNSTIAALNVPALQTPVLLPFALSLVMQNLSSPWQIIRLALKVAGSDDEIKVAATPYGVAVTMAIRDLAQAAGMLRSEIKRGQFLNVSEHLKTIHDGVRGLRTELDLRNDSPWGKQLSSIRVDISNSLKSEIESVPGRVRRLLRQRPDKDIATGARLDQLEIDEAVGLIDFVAVCRNYASELAINEVTLRTYSDLQQYVEKSTESLVQSLRGADARVKPFRQMQAQTAIRFCELLFGQDYASLMSRAAESAMVVVERKPVRAGGSRP